jgi:hypothetical protein
VQASASADLGPIVTLTNGAADAQGSGVAIDLNTFPPPATSTGVGVSGQPGKLVQYNPAARIVAQSAGNFEADLAFLCNRPGAANNGLLETMQITPQGATVYGNLCAMPQFEPVGLFTAGVAYPLTNAGIGIGTTSPRSALEASVNAGGKLGPVLTLTNPGGGQNAAAAIDFNTYNPPPSDDYIPSARIEALDDGN